MNRKIIAVMVMLFCFLPRFVSAEFSACGITDLACLADHLLPHYDPASDSKKEWSASRGTVVANKNRIVVALQFDQESLDTWNHNDHFGLEIEMVAKGGNKDALKLKKTFSTFPASAHSGTDTPVCDWITNGDTVNFAIHLLDLRDIQKDVYYYVLFEFEDDFPASGVTIKPGIQILVDIDYMYVSIVDPLVEWIPWFDQFQYYALETDHYEEFSVYPNEFNGVEWTSKEVSAVFSLKPKEEVVTDLGGQDPDLDLVASVQVIATEDDDPAASNYSVYDDESETPDGPDANIKEVGVGVANHDSYHYALPQAIAPDQGFDVRVNVTNKGDETINEFETWIYLSRDLNFDPNGDISCGREEEDDDVAPGGSTAKHRRCYGPSELGTWYVYAVSKNVEGEHGGTDQDSSNDTSRNDEVPVEEYAQIEVFDPTTTSLPYNPTPESPQFYWSSTGADPTKAVSVQISESADPHTWNDNWLGMDGNYGVQWSEAGPIADMRCTLINEPADESYWDDNYLCVPQDSEIYFAWSTVAPTAMPNNIHVTEYADEAYWEDNWLGWQVIPTVKPYLFSFAQTAEGISDDGDYYYSPVNPKTVFDYGETVYFLAKLEDINVAHRLKVEFLHEDGWGWNETWNWNDPGTGWDYTFFQTSLESPDPGTWTFTFYITTDDQNWVQLSQIQTTVLDNGPKYEYVDSNACEDLIYQGDPIWEYQLINAKTTFSVGEDIYVIAEIANVKANHRFMMEVYYNGTLWWTQGGTGDPFEEVDGMWGHSYSWLSQNAELAGTFTFKIYLDIGGGFNYLDEINVTVE